MLVLHILDIDDCCMVWTLVTVAWRVFWLRIKNTASGYVGYLRMYWISSREQPTRGGPPPLGLNDGLTICHIKPAC